MKIYYWSPFFTNIATIKAVIRSAMGFVKFSKQKVDVALIDSIGEWDAYKSEINPKIDIIKLNKIKLINFLPKGGFVKSRISYVIIFLWNFLSLIKMINHKKPNYLIIHLMTSLPIFLSIFFNKKTKIVLRISGLPKINILRYFFWKIFSKKIYKVTCPTSKTYNYILEKKIFDKEQLEVLYDPIIDIKEFRDKKKDVLNFDILKDKKFIIGIGRLTKQKNFSLLINFFNKIKSKKFDLVILGVGENKHKLKKMVTDHGIDNRVHFLGHQANVYKFLIKADCFILTSLWEDPGFVLVEAALAGTSIISSKCPNGPEEILQNEGFLFENNNINDLVNKFKEFTKLDQKNIYQKKVVLKKRIKKFTQFSHYNNLKCILHK